VQAYLARYYDAYFVGVPGDVGFYVDEARRAGSPVLELGCGTGRVLLPMARAGVRVVGLDCSGELLDRTRRLQAGLSPAVRRRIELVQADMREFRLGRRFRLAVIPYRSFQHLLTPVDQAQALECVRDHLRPRGLLAFNVYDPLLDMVADGLRGPVRQDTDFVDPESGHLVTVYYHRQYQPDDQLLEQELVFEETDQGGGSVGRVATRLTLRYTGRQEMAYLLERTGFAVEALYGDFQGGPYPGYGEQIWVARRG
jgi:SAM-dependent methyltransferase